MRTSGFLGCLLLSGAAFAQTDNPFDHRFSISAAAYWPDVDTTIRADSNDGRVGTTIDLESDLGLQDRSTLAAGGMAWNFARRHTLDLLYFELGRTATRNIDENINYSDQSFPIQTAVHSLFRTEVVRLSYGYAFINDERQRLMAQFGVHYTRVKGELDSLGGSVRAEADTNVPLPVIGIAYQRRLGEQFGFDVTAQIFRLEIDDIKGSLNNGAINFYWGPWQHCSLFAGYNYYRMDVSSQQEHWHGAFKFSYMGPWAGIVVGFGSHK